MITEKKKNLDSTKSKKIEKNSLLIQVMDYQVIGKDKFDAMFDQVFGGNGGVDSSIVSDVGVVIQMNIQIIPPKRSLPLQLNLPQSTHAPLGRQRRIKLTFKQ